MAFVNCESCGQEISDQAPACPKCGTPTAASPAAGMVGPKGADLRPLGIGEIVDAAIKLYRDHALTLLKLVALVVVPVQVVSALIGWSITPDGPEAITVGPDGTPSVDGGTVATAAAGGFVVAVLGLVGTQLATGASLKAVSDAYLGRDPAWGESLEFALGKLGSLIWIQVLIFAALFGIGIVAAVMLFLGALAPIALLLAIPLALGAGAVAIGLYIAWSLGVPALLIEDLRGTSALGRSFHLVRGRFWPVVGVFVLAWVISAVVQSVVGLIFGLIPGVVGGGLFATGTEGGASVTMLLSNIVTNSVAQTLVTPFTAAVVAIVYFDLRVRKEGFDLDLLSQGVGSGPATSGGGGANAGAEGPDDPPSAEPAEEGADPPSPGPTDEASGSPRRPPPTPPDPGWRPDPSGEAWESHDRPRRRSDEE